ncbi:methylated-DNA--[protein]-cysteine S-methyltransferase [Staphylococcus massiliensis]|uniref:methylated-DNA--[protein]-cysteine S-methyltransferase n=1 Tax=Staphylococcus massiliensis TaxID=555791 RepID=UPI001EDE517E|nr:methylated-DNA--[protein]-cysteine S-methyltransferase [Staphylococcus massiliensis]MCG3402149.1 methylated-DNA--[protein]-cysteine S-methyltransferase [Staphylococcus massiliensis]
MYWTIYTSPIGPLTVTADDTHLTGIWYEQQCDTSHHTKIDLNEHDIITQTTAWLDDYFRGNHVTFPEIPIKFQGFHFQEEVWHHLKAIPYGETTTYGAIAQRVAEARGITKMSAQAIGGAVGRNPISILVPCHRVVGAHRELTGYGGGIDKKVYLLELEGHDINDFKMPKSHPEEK